jgi:hypothetical protein
MSARTNALRRPGVLLAAASFAAALSACATAPQSMPQVQGETGSEAPAPAATAPTAEDAAVAEAPAHVAPLEPPSADGAEAAPSATQEAAAEEAAPPPEPSPMESARRGVRATLEWLARRVDGWFGDVSPDDPSRITRGRLGVSTLKREGAGFDNSVRLDARVRLPNVEERVYLFVGRDNEREGVADTPEALSRQDRLQAEAPEDRSFFAGVALAVRRNLELRLGLRGIKPYVQARYRKPWDLTARDRVEFRQTFFWRLADRFGSTTALAYEHAYSASFAVRWLTAATITQRSERYEWSSVLGAYQSFTGLRLLSVEAVGSGAQRTGVLLSDYGLQVKWLQPVYRDWLLGELVVGHFWPRPDRSSERGEAWAVGAGVSMRF